MRAARIALFLVALTPSVLASAQAPAREEPDPTRLDVERLPPEAIRITRQLYSHGFTFEAWLGGRGFRGGVGRVANEGPYARVALGYELTRWLWFFLGGEGSIHSTDAKPPPDPTVFQVVGATAELRLQLDLSARVALWLGGEAALVLAIGDVLKSYGLNDDVLSLAPSFGGQLGFDWHLVNRHHSFGLLGGARLYPSLGDAQGGNALGVHGTAYLRYVF